MIEVKHITKEFTKLTGKNKKQTFLADNDISFEAKSGEILGILGPNGAGKTTLLRIIAGIMKPTSGEVQINGLNYQENDIEIKKQIAFLSGNTRLYQDISCYELLKMCGSYYAMSDDETEKRIMEISKELNLEQFLNQRIGHLSTGQTQRVGIARCILHNPNYYILDEATSGLDIISSETILNFIKKEKTRGKCILYSTHYMEEAESICDRVILVHRGKVVATGTPNEIVKQANAASLRDAFFKLIGGVENA